MANAATTKRRVWLTAVAVSVSTALITYLVVPSVGPPLWLLIALLGIGNTGFLLTFWSMVPDTVEYGELKTGMRVEGALVGIVSFSQKVALGLGTGLVGVFLDATGYVPNAVQTVSTLHSILIMFTLVPLVLALGGALLIYFYPLDQSTHRNRCSQATCAE